MSGSIRVGIVGLGRLGKEYARNLRFHVPDAELVGACSLNALEREWAKSELAIPFVFDKYEDLLALKDLDAIFVISSTDMHAQHIKQAIQSGKHVFSEKPLAISIDACTEVCDLARSRPELITSVGFVRRFDESYQYAFQKIQSGAIGQPFLIRSQTVDKDAVAEFQIQYARKSGGIFHDFNIHDIDLTRWLMGAEFTKVTAMGGAYKYPAFAKFKDADNVLTSCELANGSMAIIGASRTAMHGHDTYTEIVGTEGTLRIGRPAQQHHVEIMDAQGIRREVVATFWERFEAAFLMMTRDFIDCVRTGRKPTTTLENARKATEVAIAFSDSFAQSQTVSLIQP